MVQRITHCPNPARWLARIAASIAPGGPSLHVEGDCWRWVGTVGPMGYGKFNFRARGIQRCTGAHRASWLAHRGEIPDDLVIDHLCLRPWCVNPWHMELVTNQINVLRGVRAWKKRQNG